MEDVRITNAFVGDYVKAEIVCVLVVVKAEVDGHLVFFNENVIGDIAITLKITSMVDVDENNRKVGISRIIND